MEKKEKVRLHRTLRDNIKRLNFLPYDITPYFSVEEGNGLIAEKIKNAKESVRMIFGEVTSRSIIDQTTIDAFNTAQESKPVKIEIIGGTIPDSENILLENLIKKGKIQYYRLDIEPMRSFCIVDNTYIRVEHPHKSFSDERDGYVLESSALASNLNIIFDRVKKKAKISKHLKKKK